MATNYIVQPKVFNGIDYDNLNYATAADQVTYNNTTSGLESNQVQGAIDELASRKSGQSTFALYMMGGFWK